MKTTKRVALLLVICLPLLASCAAAPSSRYVQLSDTHTALTEEVTALSKAGVLKVEQVEVALALLKLADDRLDRFREAIARGEDTNVLEEALKATAAILDRIKRIIQAGGP